MTALEILSDPLLQLTAFVAGSIALRRIVLRNRARCSVSKAPRRTGLTAAGPAVRKIKSGFRDLRWGEAPRIEMMLYHDGAEEKLFSRPGDVLMHGGAPLKSIFYSYRRGALQAVLMEMPHASAERVRETLEAQWGKPTRPNRGVEKYYWMQLLQGIDSMQAVLESSPLKRYASLVMTSKTVAGRKGSDTRSMPAAPLSGAKAAQEGDANPAGIPARALTMVSGGAR